MDDRRRDTVAYLSLHYIRVVSLATSSDEAGLIILWELLREDEDCLPTATHRSHLCHLVSPQTHLGLGSKVITLQLYLDTPHQYLLFSSDVRQRVYCVCF